MATVKRSYSSVVRDEQAARTKARILDAAWELFSEYGFGRTTTKEIAATAGVARDTVHAVFGTKARILTALIDRALVPDDSVTNVTLQADAQAIRNETDPRRQIELFADFIAAMSTRLRPVYEMLRTAAAVHPEMAATFGEMNRFRLENMNTYAKWFAAQGPLRVPAKRAGEIIWALVSPEVAVMLCDQLGWTQRQHASWIADTLTQTLLPDE